jgi:DNA-binding NtrC family response regulator
MFTSMGDQVIGSTRARARVLVVDDDPSICELLSAELRGLGFEPSVETEPEVALASFDADAIDVVVTDLRMQSMSGVELCERIVAVHPDVPVIVLTGHGDKDAAVAALRVRAFDFLEKPLDVDALAAAVDRAVSRREIAAQRRLAEDMPPVEDGIAAGMIGASPPMLELFQMIDRIAAVDATVLVCGESGVGKDLVARAIHERSKRRGSPFVALNCAAIPENLLEAELFGHVKGAFTDARSARGGLFEQAQGGTLFLDEIADLHLSLQPKLLRALQERAIRPLGSEREIEVDVRLITATNVDLASAVLRREFRADLFYRLNVVEIVAPPLRERGDDVLLLARHLLKEYSRAMERDVVGLTSGCAAKLKAYSWPGNVRELANVIERAVALTRWSHLDVEDLPRHVREHAATTCTVSAEDGGQALASLAEVERLHIGRVLKATGGNKSRAAEILGVHRRTLYRKDWTGTSSVPSPPAPGASEASVSLRDKFIHHRRRDTGTVRAAVARGDFEVVARLAHNMRGNGTSYGFPEISAIGTRMEAMAEACDAAGVERELLALERWLSGTQDTSSEGVCGGSTTRPQSSTQIRAGIEADMDADRPASLDERAQAAGGIASCERRGVTS